jgi:hypothetical protein
MDHATSHWDRICHNAINQQMAVGTSYSINPPLRQCKIDGSCKVEWCCARVTEIYSLLGAEHPNQAVHSISLIECVVGWQSIHLIINSDTYNFDKCVSQMIFEVSHLGSI